MENHEDKRTYNKSKLDKMQMILKALKAKTPETFLKTVMEIF